MYDRCKIKEMSRDALRAYWAPCIGVIVLYAALGAVVSVATFGLAALLIIPPLAVGTSLFFLRVWRGEHPPFETMFAGFSRYGQAVVGMLWMDLWIFLWSLLLVIPGLVKALAYSMTPYLLADYPDIDPRHALRVSMAITSGRKAEILVMYLSFLGWMLLTPFTLGILGIAYVGPYMNVAFAGQYESMLTDALEEGKITQQDLNGGRMAYIG